MAKVLGSWSGMRKYFEKEMLAESLSGRVRYNCTTYTGMDGCKTFEVVLDDKVHKQFSYETVQSYFLRTGLIQPVDSKFNSPFEYWGGLWKTLKAVPVSERTEYTDEEFCMALAEYRNREIAFSLSAVDPIQKMFAVLDRRVGKRTLTKIKDEWDSEPGWLKQVLDFRLSAEGME